MKKLISQIRNCKLCLAHLPEGTRPVVQLGADAPVVIIAQAPGRKVHESGIPFDDKSGDTLRDWLQVNRNTFYDERFFSILPMGFCYPGKGRSGDLPPRPECAPTWHPRVLPRLKKAKLILLVGAYSQKYYLGKHRKHNLTETVRHFRDYQPSYFPLVHPSPRNGIWLRRNPWMETEVLPELRLLVHRVLREEQAKN